jgi:hypothetical protein
MQNPRRRKSETQIEKGTLMLGDPNRLLGDDDTILALMNYRKAEREMWERVYADALSMMLRKISDFAAGDLRQLTPEERAFCLEHADRSMDDWKDRFARDRPQKPNVRP